MVYTYALLQREMITNTSCASIGAEEGAEIGRWKGDSRAIARMHSRYESLSLILVMLFAHATSARIEVSPNSTIACDVGITNVH